MNLREHLVNGGRVERDGDVYRLIILPAQCVLWRCVEQHRLSGSYCRLVIEGIRQSMLIQRV
jgi:hypothetical protein